MHVFFCVLSILNYLLQGPDPSRRLRLGIEVAFIYDTFLFLIPFKKKGEKQ